MNKRLRTIVDRVDKCGVFADVGCDHGYVAYEILKSGKCDFAIVSDVSEDCLRKAELLLSADFEGKFEAILSDGFEKLPPTDQAVIAGMGGELICDILSRAEYPPEKLVLQPMKNPEKVRRFLLDNGYAIREDFTFKDGKLYDLIKAEKGDDCYDEDEILFGRDNLKDKGEAFRERIEGLIETLKRTLPERDEKGREETLKKIEKYTEILK